MSRLRTIYELLFQLQIYSNSSIKINKNFKFIETFIKIFSNITVSKKCLGSTAVT